MWCPEHCLVQILIGPPVVESPGHACNRASDGGQETPDRGVQSTRTTQVGNADSDADQEIENASGSQQGLGGWIFNPKDQCRHGIKIPRRRPNPDRITAMTGEGHDQCDDRSDHRDPVAQPQGRVP